MNKKYNLKLDLQFRCNNSIMKFNQFDSNTSDFFMRITNGGNLVDIEKAIVVLAVIKPSGKVASQFVEVKNGLVYADLKPSMIDEIGIYTAQAMLILEDERVVTDVISYEVEEDKIFSLLNDTVEATEEFTLLADMLSRLSTIEISEEQRMINEAERILSEENRKIEEAKRVEVELIRQHEEADRAKYDATRESNENIRKINEEARISSENVRLENEANRIEQEANRVKAEQLRKDNYNLMTEDEERRRSEANAHKEAEALRVSAENTRVNEEAKRRTTEQARVSAENTRVSNENTRKANEVTRQTNETQRVEAETQRQNRYNSFIADAEANTSNFENYTNNAKVKEEERKSNELDRKSQEAKRVSNEVERISNENTRKANEVAREKNETSRQYVFENKVNEVDKKIVELNTTKDNFVSNINTKVDTKISEIDNVKDNFVSSISTKVDNKISELDSAKSDMTNTVSNKVNEVENRFNALTSKQQQDAEVIDARDGETSLKARLDRDIEKAKQVYVNVEGSHISTDSSVGYAKDIEILGNTIQSASNLADIRSVGDKVEGQELYEIPVLIRGKNLFNGKWERGYTLNLVPSSPLYGKLQVGENYSTTQDFIKVSPNEIYYFTNTSAQRWVIFYDKDKNPISHQETWGSCTTPNNTAYIRFYDHNTRVDAFPNYSMSIIDNVYEPYIEDKLTILSPVQLEKVGDVADRLIEKGGVWGVEKNVGTVVLNGSEDWSYSTSGNYFVLLDSSITNKIKTESAMMSDKFKYATAHNNDMAIYGGTGEKLKLSNNSFTDSVSFKQWLRDNPTLVKYQLATPQFIPLSHDQQVKLRTFANKTNISFGCEIEGTIKAQVPKSLGATVNTHTEQINNLNKELDRVKKLEESTVSTVTTESDFTTVEATTNGYFEDVKLEGKTLVNIHPKATPALSVSDRDNPKYNVTKNEGYIKVTGSDLGTTNYRYINMGRVNFEILKPNTTYTVMFTKFKGVHKICLQNGDSRYSLVNNTIDTQDDKLLYTLVTKEALEKSEQILYLWVDPKSTTVDVEVENPMIFEGDLTTNPPSGYIEGLKSVGQLATILGDGADEIVVSSVDNGNMINLSNITEGKYISPKNGEIRIDDNSFYCNTLIPISPNMNIVFRTTTDAKQVGIFLYYDKDKQFISGQELVNNTYLTMPQNTKYLRLSFYNRLHIKECLYVGLGDKPVFIEYQSDKKRLLYYNNETQTWEKPVLREWDSIEKHADGKYYYHQRSGEVVLNGSESWELQSDTTWETDTHISFYYCIADMRQNFWSTESVSICDRFNTITANNSNYTDSNEFSSTDLYKFNIKILKSRLSTQDVAGFKQWLQANNITVVYQLAQEKVYECTNIDLITYANETNYIVNCGAIVPKTTLKVHNNISNVVSLLQKKVSILESDVTSYMITQNRLMLASRYNADNVTFKVDYPSMMSEREVEIDYDLFKLIQDNIIVGPENYDVDKMLEIMDLYAMIGFITWEMWDYLYEVIDSQINPVIGDLEGTPEI